MQDKENQDLKVLLVSMVDEFINYFTKIRAELAEKFNINPD